MISTHDIDFSGADESLQTATNGQCGTHLSFGIDEATAEFFARRVPATEQQRVRRLLSVFQEIHQAGKGKQDPTIKRLAITLQMPWRTLRRNYFWYKGGCKKARTAFEPGDWRSVLNWSKVQEEKVNVPFALLEFFRTFGENNQRNWKAGYKEMLQVIRTGHDFKGRQYKKIPGCETWPAIDPVLQHPPGLSYGNLMRFKSTDMETASARIGRAAATAFRVPVLKTRVELRLGQFMEFDDHEFDTKTLFQKRPMRPLCFAAVEVLTDCLFKIGVKPTLWDEDVEMKRKLTEREFLWFFLSVLCGTGYRRDTIGTTAVLERGTTTIREPYLGRLRAVLGEFVKFYFGSNAGNNTRAAHAGQFSGQPKGNFRTKAIIESKWNPLNNQLASIMGAVGKDRDHAPAQIYGAEKYTGQMVRAAEERNIPLENFQLPFHHYHEWCQFAHEAVHRINTDREHSCEGWEKLGFIRKFWRTDEASQLWHSENDFKLLGDLDRAVIRAKLVDDKTGRLTKVERAHRMEVFQSLRRELTRLPMDRIPEIVGAEFALRSASGGEQMIEVGKQLSGLLSFDCAEIDSDTLHFYARDEKSAAGELFPNGQKFICFVNPYLPTHLIACDEQLRVKAVCPRYERAHDEASLHRNMGEQSAQEAKLRVKLNLRHDDESRRKSAMKEHNAAVLAGGVVDTSAPRPAADCTEELLAREGETPETNSGGW